MKYIEKFTLKSRGPVDPGPDVEVEGSLLVGEEAVLSYYGNQNQFGEDRISLFPAYANGERAWLLQEAWCPGYGYSASGTNESVISFEAGLKLVAERGDFSKIFTLT